MALTVTRPAWREDPGLQFAQAPQDGCRMGSGSGEGAVVATRDAMVAHGGGAVLQELDQPKSQAVVA